MAPPGIGTSSQQSRPPTKKNQEIVILDGGFATQLSCHVSQPIDGDVLWSARYLASNPEAVIYAHMDFLRAGADLIITNTYQASVDLFSEHLKLSKEESYNLIKKAVELAKEAVRRYLEDFPDDKKPLVVGSVGPYGASLHDGSEYNGSYANKVSAETMREWHIPRIDALVEAGVDMLAIETIPCRVEAEMLVKLLKEKYPQMKAWLSFSVGGDGKTTAFGEPFQETARACYDLNPEQLVAVGVNCTAPRLIEPLIAGINNKRSVPIPLIVYPNSGESYSVELGWINRNKCEPVESYVPKWLDLGVTWVGGCCRTYAVDVGRIRREVEKWKRAQTTSEME
ncbi:uncharacterized protein LOC126734806 isoform X2 [Anthonomus grandis grandis]|uniref:uncharacterized protein LOC126734806 isoform X2 n=1 Tax=Anthonomus grandis grandis TaxID=2921223 RepID=UPI002165982F|nr:uncharacterized protein LOC126734806 isoform X2 [Anthonomus grandis grandis]